MSRAEYNLTRDLVILTRPDAPGAVRAFLDFVLSPAGQAIVGQRYGRVRQDGHSGPPLAGAGLRLHVHDPEKKRTLAARSLRAEPELAVLQ